MVVACIVIYFLGLLIVLPFEVLGATLQVLTLGAFSAKTASGGLRAWVSETTSLVPLLALSLLRWGTHHTRTPLSSPALPSSAAQRIARLRAALPLGCGQRSRLAMCSARPGLSARAGRRSAVATGYL